MDLYNLMKNRRSTRDFSTKDISKATLKKILKSGFLSPSGIDQKPFIYIVVDDNKIKSEIRRLCEKSDKKYFEKSNNFFKEWIKNKKITFKKDLLEDAPYLIVVAGDTTKPYWLESTWISISYILLAAENEGLATLTYTPGEFDFLYNLLDIPSDFKPVVIIPVGYAKNKIIKKADNSNAKIHYNRYNIQ